MDRLIYVAMSGAKQTLNQQETVSHNLANLSTNGYKAQTAAFRVVPVVGEGAPTRAFVVDSTPSPDFTPGAIDQTGRDLDIAVQGTGWIAVQAADGSEAYTRSGALEINSNGLLQTQEGHIVIGDGGPIAIPTDTLVTIANDGTVSTVPTGDRPRDVTNLGQIKLVNPPESSLTRGDDGLFRVSGPPPQLDPNVRIVSGALERSNVNVVDCMVSMIALARQFDMQVKMMQNSDSNARAAAQLLTV